MVIRSLACTVTRMEIVLFPDEWTGDRIRRIRSLHCLPVLEVSTKRYAIRVATYKRIGVVVRSFDLLVAHSFTSGRCSQDPSSWDRTGTAEGSSFAPSEQKGVSS